MIKYHTDYSLMIEEVEVVLETKCSVLLLASHWYPRDRWEKKITEWGAYHDTWEEARDYLLEKQVKIRQAAHDQVMKADRIIAEIKAMAPPVRKRRNEKEKQ